MGPVADDSSDDESRKQAFLSGFVRDLVVHKPLHDEILPWIINEGIYENRRDLRYAYIRAIQSCTDAKRELITSDCLKDMLQKMGASQSATAVTIPVVPTRRPIEGPVQDPPEAVWNFVDMLRCLSPHLSASARDYGVLMLLKMTSDTNVTGSSILQVSIKRTIAALITDIPDTIAEQSLRNVSESLAATIQNTTLRLHVLTSIPSTTPRLHAFRRGLAGSYFLGSASYDSPTASLRGSPMVALVLHHLSNPPFAISAMTDYGDLFSLFIFLDAFVDSGISTFPINDKEEETAFNNSIDALVRELRRLSGCIVDSGASHMKRTECKVVLDRLIYRLEFAVRTKVRPRQNLFGRSSTNDPPEKGQTATLMEQFLKKQNLQLANEVSYQ